MQISVKLIVTSMSVVAILMDFDSKEKGLSNTRVKKVTRVDIGRAENGPTATQYARLSAQKCVT